MQYGRFLSFEGLDGTGKSTHVRQLAETLRARGLEVVTTREPGGTVIGERTRQILLDSHTQNLAPMAELALMFASRAQLIDELILPALERGAWVLCDRFVDSSEAYQSGGRGLSLDVVLALHRLLCRNLWPDLTILLDNDVAASVARARRRNVAAAETHDENRFEQEKLDFYERVHRQYLALAHREPRRVRLIDARREFDAVHPEVLAAVEELFASRGNH